MNKKLVTSVLAAAMMASMAFTASADVADLPEEVVNFDYSEMKWGFIVGSFEHIFYQNVGAGIEEECAALGLAEDQYSVTDCNLEADKAINQIQNFTTNKCNAIALACNDAAGCVPGINEATGNGVAMFNFDSKADDMTNVIAFVGTDNVEGGRLGGQELIRLSEDGDTVAIIGNPESVSTQDRESGALEVLEGADRKVLAGYNYEGDANKAEEIMSTILTSNPEVKAVFCAGDPAATGALAAIKAAGSECVIVGFDGNPEAKEALVDPENGKWWVSEVCQDAVGIGKGIVDQMAKYFATGEVDDQIIYIAPYIITAETLAAEEAETE